MGLWRDREKMCPGVEGRDGDGDNMLPCNNSQTCQPAAICGAIPALGDGAKTLVLSLHVERYCGQLEITYQWIAFNLICAIACRRSMAPGSFSVSANSNHPGRDGLGRLSATAQLRQQQRRRPTLLRKVAPALSLPEAVSHFHMIGHVMTMRVPGHMMDFGTGTFHSGARRNSSTMSFTSDHLLVIRCFSSDTKVACGGQRR